MDKLSRFKADVELLSASEKRAVKRALNTREPLDIVAIVTAKGRTHRRRASDRATDRRRRVLVGARVPRALYERVRACAAARGVSVYRFVVDLLEREVAKTAP